MNINLIGPLKMDISEVNADLFTIFIDGGLDYKTNFQNSISVGDSDSTSLEHDIQLVCEKDESDFFHSLQLIPSNSKEIFCYGLFGGRLDHQLFILGEVQRFLIKKNYNFSFFHDNNLQIMALPKGKHKFSVDGIFSLFTFSDQKLLLTGKCKYQITKNEESDDGDAQIIQKYSSHGLSNEGNGEVELECDEPIFVFFNPGVIK